MFIELNWMNSGITSASSGTICTTSTSTRTVVRKGNWNRDTATAASSASSPLITTVPSPTSSEFFRNVVNPPSPSTYWKFSSEKSVGSRCAGPVVGLGVEGRRQHHQHREQAEDQHRGEADAVHDRSPAPAPRAACPDPPHCCLGHSSSCRNNVRR